MKRPIELDTECYVDYYLVKFRNYERRETIEFEMRADCDLVLDVERIKQVLLRNTIITFNGNNYDLPMLHLALKLCEDAFVHPEDVCRQLKEASDAIILGDMRGWQFMQLHELMPLPIDHVDLIEVAFGQGSLKLYGGRLHSRKLQDLPIDPSERVGERHRIIADYCGNDLETTGDLRVHLTPQIELREQMTAQYGVDLRSKSDAQIAEAVLKSELLKRHNIKATRPEVLSGTSFLYRAPAFVSFKTPPLQQLLKEITTASFVIAPNGQPIEPAALKDRVVNIGGSAYRMGIGGLHSSETSVAHYADDDTLLLDRDVTSYYPSIILQCRLYPKHLGEPLLHVYRDIFERRVAAKMAGHKTTADTLKIVLNGSFGKFGSPYSVLYAPDLLIQVTVTGQLCLLMLIEALEAEGILVVSANTDGIVIKCPKSRKARLDAVVAEWEARTGFNTEETQYRALFSRDVNNYLAIKAKGGTKGKGAFAPVSISKNPKNQICTDAVIAYLEHGTPIGETILRCQDVRQFLTVRTVRGGAIRVTDTKYDESLTPGKKRDLLIDRGWRVAVPGTLAKMRVTPPNTLDTMGETHYSVEEAYRRWCGEDEYDYLGKVVRFVYAEGEPRGLHYLTKNKTGGRNLVPDSIGAMPLMDLPEEFPDGIDYDRYIAIANGILRDIGL